jgi:two-component system sensor histidine kinase KdpD
VVAAASGLGALVFGRAELTAVVMLYLLGIVAVASRFGHGPSLTATVLSVVAYDVFFVPPYFSFAVAELRHITTFAVMFVVAAVISALTQRVRRQADTARAREQRTASLYALSRDLAGASSIDELAQAVDRHIREVFACDSALLLPTVSGALVPAPGATLEVDEAALKTAQTLWRAQSDPHPKELRALPLPEDVLIPLRAARGPVGILALPSADANHRHEPEQRQLLGTFAHQIALAIERAQLSMQAQAARIQVETEQLRNALLSSVSHDLRTPLAVIKGAGSALVEGNDSLAPDARSSFAEAIVDEADRLNRLVGNLLDMTRLDAGVLAVKKEWQSVEELVGSALGHLEDRLREHHVAVDVPAELPLVPCDAVLVEQVLINLLENAARHGAPGAKVELRARAMDAHVEICVMDGGPGIPEGQEEKIFEKFYSARQGQGGIGLGLTICRGIVVAHGGRIWAQNRNTGGAEFCFTVPLPKQVAKELP